MAIVYLSPAWFYGYDVALELIFAVISFIIAVFAFKIYKASSQYSTKFLGISFILISLSYVIQSIFNFIFISELNDSLLENESILHALMFDQVGLYLHMIVMMIGLAVLLFMTLKPTKERTFWILMILTLIPLLVTASVSFKYYLMASIYLGFIAWHFLDNFLSNKQSKSFIIALAFMLLFFSSFSFFLSITHEIFYAVGHFLELAAYILILVNFYLVLKK